MPVGDGDAQAVGSGANRQVEQVEFVAALGIDATDARRVQPVFPGQVALVFPGQHVQQRQATDVDALLAPFPRIHAGCAHRNVPLLKQQRAVQAIPLAVAKTDRAIQRTGFRQAVLQARGDAQFQLWMPFAQAPQARHQPTVGERRWCVDVQAIGVGFLLNATHRQLDFVKGLVQRSQQHPAGAGQLQVMVTPLQQVLAQLFFQLPHLAADGALGHVEQLGGAGEAAGATSHLECFEGIQAGHFAFHERLSRTGDKARRIPRRRHIVLQDFFSNMHSRKVSVDF
ncbi:hypothetical protein D3C87_1332270 [compost metagenome]